MGVRIGYAASAAAREQRMRVVPHKLTPETNNSFWVNLIGRGYPTPRKLFRWCTERLKIDPSNRFIRGVVRENGQAFPARPADDHLIGPDDWKLLGEVCGDDEHFFEIAADMLDVERKFRGMTRRAGVFDALEDCLKAGQFANEEEAIRIRTEQEARLKAAEGEEPKKSPQKTLFEDEEGEVGGG